MIDIRRETDSDTYVVVSGGKTIGAIYVETSGYYVFEPAVDMRGYWTESMLKCILDQLESMNKVWDDQVNEYFNNERWNSCVNSRCTT